MNTTATTLSPPVLAARDTRKSSGKGTVRFAASAGASLSVHAGESIAIVGRRALVNNPKVIFADEPTGTSTPSPVPWSKTSSSPSTATTASPW